MLLRLGGGEHRRARLEGLRIRPARDREVPRGGRCPGGHAGGATPVPIPNTVVKPSRADGTALVTAWESRSLPGISAKGAVEAPFEHPSDSCLQGLRAKRGFVGWGRSLLQRRLIDPPHGSRESFRYGADLFRKTPVLRLTMSRRLRSVRALAVPVAGLLIAIVGALGVE